MNAANRDAMCWTEAQFWAEFGSDESSRVEFKERVPKAGKLQEPLVAFANSGSGGTIICGVDESRPRQIVGVRWGQEENERIQEAARATQPPLHPDVRTVDIEGRTVALIAIEALHRGWVQTSDGRLLMRAGPTNRALVGEQLARFVVERGVEPAEDRAVDGTSIADLRADEFDGYLRQRLRAPRSDTADDARALGFLAQDGRARLAALLVFGIEPQRDRRRMGIEITRYAGPMDGERTFRDKRELAGTLRELVEAADRAIYDEMRRDAVIRGLIREEIPEFPPVAIREALVNAVGHRDYSLTGASVVVRLFDDGIEIESPGTLAGPVTLETLRDAQYSRNPRIMGLLHDLRLVEEAGTGIDRMVDAMEDALLDPPEFAERPHSFSVRFRGRSIFSAEDRLWVAQLGDLALSAAAKVALVYARRNGAVTNEDLRDLRSLDVRASRTILQALVARDLLEISGRGRGTKYLLGPAARDVAGAPARDEQVAAVVAHARRIGSVANRDVRGLLQIDRPTALALVERAVELGLLKPVGETRGRRYMPVGE